MKEKGVSVQIQAISSLHTYMIMYRHSLHGFCLDLSLNLQLLVMVRHLPHIQKTRALKSNTEYNKHIPPKIRA